MVLPRTALVTLRNFLRSHFLNKEEIIGNMNLAKLS